MAFCKKCGKEIEDGATFCPDCGTNQNENSTVDSLASNDKLMCILAYLGLLVLVPIIFAKDSKAAKFNANQGLWLAIIGIVGGIIPIVQIFIGAVVLVFAIIGIVNVAQDKYFKALPLFDKLPTLLK